MALKKNDIFEQLHARLSFPKNQSKEIIEIHLEIIKSNLAPGDDFPVSGFDKFCEG